MQKFRVKREFLKEVLGNAFYRIEHIYRVLPEYIDLEGELLEGGTVGKCGCALCNGHRGKQFIGLILGI